MGFIKELVNLSIQGLKKLPIRMNHLRVKLTMECCSEMEVLNQFKAFFQQAIMDSLDLLIKPYLGEGR